MKYKNKIIVGLIILVIAVAALYFKEQLIPNSWMNKESIKPATPRTVTMKFFNQWLEERKSTTTTPYESGLLQSTVLTDEVRLQIERAHANRVRGDVDPVLCLPKIPNRIDGEDISISDNKAVVLVKPRDKSITTEHQAVVSLTLVGDQWLITKLDCMVGEMMAEKEFDFEKSGVLLKNSIEAPYSKENWHLVYEQETEAGYVVPLTFNTESICVSTDSKESVCDTNTLTETTKVFIQAGMTETGAVVKRMTFE
ncbi:MAG: hypothetical protein AAB618_00675 [Patescibacteria group bacterium]